MTIQGDRCQHGAWGERWSSGAPERIKFKVVNLSVSDEDLMCVGKRNPKNGECTTNVALEREAIGPPRGFRAMRPKGGGSWPLIVHQMEDLGGRPLS